MPICLEFEAKNVEKAVEQACVELNCSKDKIKYDVISYGSTGIFGLVGVKKPRIHVTLPDDRPEAELRKPLRYVDSGELSRTAEARYEAKSASEKISKVHSENVSDEAGRKR